MMDQRSAYNDFINQLKDLDSEKRVTLVAVSKTYPAEDIQKIYDLGQRDFGENRVQELTAKYEELPKDIRWHQIGHLQTNKVKYIAPFIHLIHSVDSKKVLKEINKQGRKAERVINCLLQFHIAEEDSKYGLTLDQAKELLEGEFYKNAEHINICGVMGMATFTDDHKKVREEFDRLGTIFKTLKADYFSDHDDFKEISMGMSGDYPVAIKAGSTMVRVGSKIFGKRN